MTNTNLLIVASGPDAPRQTTTTAPLNPTDRKPLIGRIGFGQLSFSLTARKLVVCRGDRDDLPHLTLSWGNPSGEMDLHLTKVSADGARSHLPLGRTSESRVWTAARNYVHECEGALRGAIEIAFAQRRSVRPGWLARQGYLVFAATADDNRRGAAIFQELVPKVRKRYRIDMGLLKSPALQDFLRQFHYHPRVLRIFSKYPDECRGATIRALPVRRGPPPLALFHMTDRRGRLRWCALDERITARAMFRAIANWLIELHAQAAPEHFAVAETIYQALAFHEVEGLRGSLDGIGKLAGDPGVILRRAENVVSQL